MKLAAKLTLVLILGICAVMAYYQITVVEEETRRHQVEMQDDLLTVGRLFRPTVERTWRTEGEHAALYLLEYTKQTLRESDRVSNVDVRWISLDPDAPEPSRPQVDLVLLGPLLQGHEVSMVARSPDDEERLYSYVPLDVGMEAGDAGALEISESLVPLELWVQRLRERAWMTALWLVAVCGVLTGLVGLLFIALPTRKLAAAVERIGAGDLDVRVDLRQRDELGTLARGINEMCMQLAASQERLRTEHQRGLHLLEQLRHADRLAVMGKLTAGLAHELGTPLAVVAGRATMIAEGMVKEEEDVVMCARTIARQVDKMTAIIRQLLDFSRPRDSAQVPQDLRALAEETVIMLRPIAQERSIELALHAGREISPTARVDGGRIQQVLSNLIVNAMDAMEGGGIIAVGIERHQGELCLYVQDQGKGIPQEHLTRVFDPFFTTKPPGKGTGLGLSVSQGIIREHGGRIEVQSEVGRGTRFSVFLPACEPLSQSGTDSASS